MAISCVEPHGDPTGVPLTILDKKLFDPSAEWFVGMTVIDSPANAAFTFVGDSNITEKFRWDVQENFLYAYRSYALIAALDPDVAAADQVKVPIAAYPIRRHLDVIDGQLIDAPKKAWYERSHIEVDWTSNALTNNDFLADKLNLDRAGYFVSEPGKPESPIFQDGYIEVVNRFVAKPSSGTDPDTGGPNNRCEQWELFDIQDCAPMEVAVRTSFMRRESDDYVPQPWNRDPQAEGQFDGQVFYNGQYGVSSLYGFTETGKRFREARYNIWQKNLGTDGKPLPFRQRTLKPLTFYLAAGWPAELKGAAARALANWNSAFEEGLRSIRRIECQEAGESGCDRYLTEAHQVLILCSNNPVIEGDPPECGPVGTAARRGDLRYKQLDWVDSPNVVRLVGYGWWWSDGELAQLIGARGAVYAYGINRLATRLAEDVSLQNSEVDLPDYLAGLDVREWTEKASTAVARLGVSQQELTAAAEAQTAPPTAPLPPPPPGQSVMERGAQALNAAEPWRRDPLLQARQLAALKGSPVERELLTQEDLLAGGQQPGAPLSEAVLDAASPLRNALGSQARQQWQQRLGMHGVDLSVPDNYYVPELVALAKEYRGKSRDEVYQSLRERGTYTGLTHEIGHLLGLRHNMAGSFDALNFAPQYWALRNDGSVGPRYKDPETQAELEGGIGGYAYSSVMDYHPEFLPNMAGLGKFDRALIKYLYYGLREVMNYQGPNRRMLVQMGIDRKSFMPGPLLVTSGASYDDQLHEGLHYSSYPRAFGNLEDRSDVRLSSLVDFYSVGVKNATADGRVAVPYRACSDASVGQFPWCARYDVGADYYELVASRIHRFHSNYVFDNFRRDRLVFDVRDYNESYWELVFRELRNLNTLMVAHKAALRRDTAIWAADDGLANWSIGVTEAFNFLGTVLTLPQYGRHEPLQQLDGTTFYAQRYFWPFLNDPNVQAGDLVISPFRGRAYQSTIDTSSTPENILLATIGSSVDKALALRALTDTSWFTFPGRETWQDAEFFYANYFDTYPTQTLELLGGVISQDLTHLAPHASAGAVSWRRFDLPYTAPPSGSTRVDPVMPYELQVRTLGYALPLLLRRRDLSFVDYSRLYLKGSSELLSTTRMTTEYADPFTGTTYVAERFPHPSTGLENGVAARLVDRANLLANRWRTETDPYEQGRLRGALVDLRAVMDLTRSTIGRLQWAEANP
ncbi:MAG: hypothetical protein IPJ65_25990 [Archangiaceae bacterium]|nr:hypothetical protein [Archangiaceae bacterium]